MARQLEARINAEVVGTLSENNGIWSFTYAAPWIKRGDSFALSPALPLQTGPLQDDSTTRSVQWYFDNLLPEEQQRTLIAKDANVAEADAFGLLAHYGAESAGSLTLLQPGITETVQGADVPLTDNELQRRIDALPRTPLSHDAPKKMSLAGAQHKLPVTLHAGALHEPTGASASTHILKPDHSHEVFPHSVINEYFCMRLAARLGLRVPHVTRRYVPSPVYLVERFDRVTNTQPARRLHCIDACQLMNLDRTFKYNQGSMEALARVAELCRNRPATRRQLFEWLVFNVLIGNSDAHLKNLSFMVSHEGIALAPHYDLLATAVYESRTFEHDEWPERTKLAWPVMGTRKFSDLNREQMLAAGAVLSLGKETCERIVDKMRDDILATADAVIAEIATHNEALDGVAAILAGEMRCLRAIREVVIREMVERLR